MLRLTPRSDRLSLGRNVYYRDPEQVEPGEKEVCSVLHVAEHDGVDKNCHTDTKRPTCDTEAVSLCAHARAPDFGRDQEGDGTPGRRIDKVEQEEHGDGGGREFRCVLGCARDAS